MNTADGLPLPPTSARTLHCMPAEGILARSDVLRPEAGFVHVWCFEISGDAQLTASCRALLSSEERARADRFVFERDRDRFTFAHGVLRHLLALYTRRRPAELRFKASPTGKPRLCGSGTDPIALDFNLSHSAGRALVGVSDGSPLGVDIEEIRSGVSAREISGDYFAGSEQAAIDRASDADVHDVFFRYWVAKEAVLKAQGVGLGFDLGKFCMEFEAPHEQAGVTSLEPAILAPDWRVQMLTADPGWSAAVCARGASWRVRCMPPPAPR